MVTVVGSGDAGHVGNVLRQRLLAVDREIGKRLVGVVLRGEFAVAASKCEDPGGVHQFRTRPFESNVLPSVSKVWLISWPMTVPMAP